MPNEHMSITTVMENIALTSTSSHPLYCATKALYSSSLHTRYVGARFLSYGHPTQSRRKSQSSCIVFLWSWCAYRTRKSALKWRVTAKLCGKLPFQNLPFKALLHADSANSGSCNVDLTFECVYWW